MYISDQIKDQLPDINAENASAIIAKYSSNFVAVVPVDETTYKFIPPPYDEGAPPQNSALIILIDDHSVLISTKHSIESITPDVPDRYFWVRSILEALEI